MKTTPEQLQNIIEAAVMVAGRPMKIIDIQKLFDEADQPSVPEIRLAISSIGERYTSSGIEFTEVASGYQFQAKTELSPWLSRLWEERPARYTRAFLETLALIAYRQPITRAEIEEIRGVSVSSNIVKSLMEREWVRIMGYKDVPGKPALYGTTRSFLDHFNLKSLSELPTLAELKDLDSQEAKLQVQLELSHSENDIDGELDTFLGTDVEIISEEMTDTTESPLELTHTESDVEAEMDTHSTETTQPETDTHMETITEGTSDYIAEPHNE